MDFFDRTSDKIDTLTKSELKIYNYILDNLEIMHTKTVRVLAKECYVSTSTILRLVKKIGFDGYNEMVIIIKNTLNLPEQSMTTITEKKVKYKEEYAKNVMESIRVLDDKQLVTVTEKIKECDNLYIFSRGLVNAYSSYIEFLFEINNIKVHFASNGYYRQFYTSKIKTNDFIIIVDYHGNDKELINTIITSKAKSCENILTITQANNNIMQNLSKYNFYYFSDETIRNGFDITSNISVLAILELLIHNL